VKEIFDKCRELSESRDDIVIFNQFDAFGNHLWHYQVTGPALEEVWQSRGCGKNNDTARTGGMSGYGGFSGEDSPAGVVLSSGSAGTLGCADYLKAVHPTLKVAVAEALQCPTLLYNGFGGHRIEGIGDKHVPWIHNVRNTDMVIGVDDELTIRLLRLFNEEEGRNWLEQRGVPKETTRNLGLLGISSIGNLIAAVKFAKYYELGEADTVFTVFTDSMELYGSRLRELRESRGPYGSTDAVADYEALMGIGTDHTLELRYYDRRRIHNLKYYTWVEQQGKEVSELEDQWKRHKDYWAGIHEAGDAIDGLIEEFNQRVGLLR
jgi:cysteine synthase